MLLSMLKPVLPQDGFKKIKKLGFTIIWNACLFLLFRPHHEAYRILVSQPGLEPRVPAPGVQSLNDWTLAQLPQNACLNVNSC